MLSQWLSVAQRLISALGNQMSANTGRSDRAAPTPRGHISQQGILRFPSGPVNLKIERNSGPSCGDHSKVAFAAVSPYSGFPEWTNQTTRSSR